MSQDYDMARKKLFKDWLYTSILSFILYDLLWNFIVEHSWDINNWSIYCFDLFYCSVFTAISIGIGEFIIRLRLFKMETLQRHIELCLLTLIVNLILAFLFEKVYSFIYPEYDSYAGIYLFCFIATLLTSIHSVVYYYQLIVDQKKELLKLKKQEFKYKLDPHFVFNSLNVLVELINQNSKQAENYCILFARLYRHILTNIDYNYISINEALVFAQEYVKLRQYSTEGKIELIIDNIIYKTDEYLFPLAIQTLVENAIKHNTPDNGQVLTIRITRDSDNVVVTNNRIGDTNHTATFGIGLQTLQQQYKMENLPEPHIKNNNEIYEVTIPILKKKKHA